MTQVQWGLLDQGGLNAFSNSLGMGMQMGQDLRLRQDQEAQRRQQQQDRAREEQTAAQQAERQRVEQVARLFEGVTPENYASRVQAAQSLGIDTGTVPPAYDPAWVEQNRAIFGAFLRPDGQQRLTTLAQNVMLANGITDQADPRLPGLMSEALRQENARYVPVQAGGSVAAIVPGQDPRYIVGGPEAPQAQQGPQEGATATNPATGERVQFRGGRWVPMQGGPTPQASGNFPVSPAP